MSIHVALNHKTIYEYDRAVGLSPNVVRLRPAPHCRTKILAYTLKITPEKHFLNWQQDPYSNYLARVVFPEKTQRMTVEVDLVAELTALNPFDFFVEAEAEKYPFTYEPTIRGELTPYLAAEPMGPKLAKLVYEFRRKDIKTVDYLVELNQQLQKRIKYLIRLEPGLQSCEKTLEAASGSCRDSAWLLVQVLRNLGIAARFVSGYLIQLKSDVPSLDGPSGASADFTDLHAWAEAYVPGAGWIGLDPTSGLLADEGHIPLAATAEAITAAPVSGAVDECEVKFGHEMSVRRLRESPRVTKPYSAEQWVEIDSVGASIDERLKASDVRLTMGGEPTFVGIDHVDSPEWNTEAFGENKRKIAGVLFKRLHKEFAPGGLLHYGLGKWYPGEQLPRWALGCYWRKDGTPIWEDEKLIADESVDYRFGPGEAKAFVTELTRRLEVDAERAIAAYEDVWHYLLKERRLPVNVDPLKSNLKDEQERARMARIFEQGLEKVIGYALPLRPERWNGEMRWRSGPWFFRPERMYLIPGDSPMGFRLPLDSLPWAAKGDMREIFERDPMETREPLPDFRRGRDRGRGTQASIPGAAEARRMGPGMRGQEIEKPPRRGESMANLVRTALCVEPRGGRLHVFMPPMEYLEDYLELVARIEETAADLKFPLHIEGYRPPHDPRVKKIGISPDPGVIEVNMHAAENWDELVKNTKILYEQARLSRLRTEKFDLDGKHTGTGGGNHIVIGGPTAADSPVLRRPHLLKSLVGFWHNHPSMSYLFSSAFIGPTSQAPRVDEGRRDMVYELELAGAQIPDDSAFPPWLVDRVYRNILVDGTGNTHRAEFCVDKLFTPEASVDRRGLLECRGFEMPPHAEMSLAQHLVLRGLIAHFWDHPYKKKLVRWGTEIHDRFLLPHFAEQDFSEVLEELGEAGIAVKREWFAPHLEFRFPFIGQVSPKGVELTLRSAIEPWYVLGEEGAAGGTVRYVDSSVERLEVKVKGMVDTRHLVTCNGRQIPLHPTGTNGEFVAGVRYRAWQPPSCLHPTIGVHTPLTFDVVDTWNGRSIGGCIYHVSHPGGRASTAFPVNALEAEGRRLSRFFTFGHTPGAMLVKREERSREFPFTLDLRKS